MQDEQLRRLLQQYIFNLEDAQEKAEELSVANEGLQRTAEFFKAVLNCTPHGICLVKKHTFQWCSPAFTDILGWQQQDLHSLSILEMKEERMSEDTPPGCKSHRNVSLIRMLPIRI